MGQNIESLLRAADTAGRTRRPDELQKRLVIVAALLRDAPPEPGPRLLWRDPQGITRSRTISRDLLIGRDPACDIALATPMVSRRHCRLLCRAGHVLLLDLGSTHGTRINGVIEKQSVLADGDIIQAGETALVYSSA